MAIMSGPLKRGWLDLGFERNWKANNVPPQDIKGVGVGFAPRLRPRGIVAVDNDRGGAVPSGMWQTRMKQIHVAKVWNTLSWKKGFTLPCHTSSTWTLAGVGARRTCAPSIHLL